MKGIRAYNPTQLYIDGLLGQYWVGASTGAIPAGTTGELFQFRWPDTTRIAAIRKVTIAAVNTTGFTTPTTPLQFDIVKATAWTVQGTGGTVLDTTAGAGKRRTSMPTSLLTSGDVRIATTAALGAGTKTLDSQAAATALGQPSTGTATFLLPNFSIMDLRPGEIDYPLHLVANEGFVLRLTANGGTADVTFVSVSVEWVEVDPR